MINYQRSFEIKLNIGLGLEVNYQYWKRKHSVKTMVPNKVEYKNLLELA